MNEKPDPRTRLVADAFNDDWAAGPAAFAHRAAAHARRRRAMRQTLLTGSLAAAVLAVIFVATRAPVSVSRAPSAPPASTAPASSVIASVAKNTLTFEIISDDELLAQLRDRPVLVLPAANGGRKIVLLDD